MLTGMTVLKNATKMGYPWVESILSVIDVCDHYHVGEGYSDDDTWEILQRLKYKYGEKLSLSRYQWPVMDTGFAIGAATNNALENIRHLGGKILYVQADELWHPDSAREAKTLSVEDYDGFRFPYLHLEHNCQVEQVGAGYKMAIRMVANRREITSHRDAWTFEGCENVLTVMSLPHSIVHCNYCFWDNVVVKKEVQASDFYRDLGHYKASAEDARETYDAHDEPPPEFTAKTSPFESHIPPIFLPMIGERKYYVRERLLW